MKVRELLNAVDEIDCIQFEFISCVKTCSKYRKLEIIDMLDMEVKKIRTDGCAMLFVEIGWP